ncbi:MAG: hypothetical protein ABGZ17_21595, partial [Planctomycetaceae bacterium]
HRSESVKCGPLYHAVSGLVIYRNRLREALKQTAAAPAESAPSGTRKPQVSKVLKTDAEDGDASRGN